MPASKTQPRRTPKAVRYGIRWHDGLEWVGPFASLTLRQATKLCEDTAKDGTACKVCEYKPAE